MPSLREIRRSHLIDGVLLLDKPSGISSNAALQRARRAFGAKRAGHSGTLDPLASGLLIVCFGEATKFSGRLLESDKAYRARVVLGIRTTTADAEGEVVDVRPVSITRERLLECMTRFVGEIRQVPPMHSALKHDGRPLYDYARRGISLERAARKVFVRSLELQDFDSPYATVFVRCGKGTYIRTLAEDLGEALGCCGHLGALVRTAVGRYSLDQAYSLAAVEGARDEDRSGMLLPTECLLEDLPKVQLDGSSEAGFLNGRSIGPLDVVPGHVRVFGEIHGFLGLGEADGMGQVRPRRLVASA